MSVKTARRIADAVLYEGYVLYPYRSTSAKNQVRWQFGVLGPVGAVEAGVGEESAMQTEVLLEPDPGPGGVVRLDLRIRFLQAQYRAVEQASGDAGDGFRPVAALEVGPVHWVGWHEAVEREVMLTGVDVAELTEGRSIPVDLPGGEDVELLHEPDGTLAGRLVRTRWPLRGRALVSARTPDGAERPLTVVTIRLRNLEHWRAGTKPGTKPGTNEAGQTARDLAARTSFIGTHLLAEVTGGRFLSLTDPPDWAAGAAASCVNQRCWPVLVGEPGSDDVVLASPIILSDHPVVAEESPGDFFDATEIDEMLTLRVMTLTDEEKAEARGTDPRAAAIIDRCDSMPNEVFERLHGVVRSPRDDVAPPLWDPEADAAASPFDDGLPLGDSDVPWWDPGADASVSPEHDTVRIAGVEVRKGSLVVLRPSRRADAQDLFLAGLTAVVAAVYSDVDGQTHVAVTLKDDPASDLHQWYGRFYYFGPEELEPVPAGRPESAIGGSR